MLEGIEAYHLPGACWQFMQHHYLPLLLDNIFVAGSAFAYKVFDFALHPWPAQCVVCLPVTGLVPYVTRVHSCQHCQEE